MCYKSLLSRAPAASQLVQGRVFICIKVCSFSCITRLCSAFVIVGDICKKKVGISNACIAKQANTVPQRTKRTKCLPLANGCALKPSQEFALTDVSWWTFAQKSLKCLILHPVSVGTLLSCTFCVSIKLGWKQSLLFTEQILFYVERWTITTITLSAISISSIKNACTLNSELESPGVEPNAGIHDWWKVSDHTGVMVEGSFICILPTDAEKVNHALWIAGTISCPHSKEELSMTYQKAIMNIKETLWKPILMN